MLVWNPISLASPEKEEIKSPNTPYCNKGDFAVGYRFLELLYPHCCKDEGMWEHSKLLSASSPLVKSGVCSSGQRVVLMLSEGQGHRFFLAIVELLGGWGRHLGLQ